MNHHELVDVATVTASAFALRDATFFARSLDSPPIGAAVTESRLELGGLERGAVHEVTVTTPHGEFDGAYLVSRWYGDDAPTVLFHHGSGENPFDFGRFSTNSFGRLFVTDAWDLPVNLVGLRAPFHDRSSVAYARAMGDLGNFVGMCAASTALAERLVERLHERGCPSTAVSGISLGGWVTNLHRAFYGTADRYVPIFAGAALGEMFVTSVYRKMTGRLAQENPGRLRETLDFERAFTENPDTDCTPLLARYDRIIEFDEQRSCYDEMPLATIEKGHVTGSLATADLRAHVRDALG